MAQSFLKSLIDVDGGLIKTLREAIVRPHQLARAYISGKRTGVFGPVRYYVIAVVTNIAVGTLLGEFVLGWSAEGGDGFWDQAFVEAQITLAYAFLLLPLAAASKWVRVPLDLNITEHYVFLMYLLGNGILSVLVASVALALVLQQPLINDWDGIVGLGTFIAYLVAFGPRFYGEGVVRFLLRLVASSVGFVMFLVAVGGVLMLLE